ncbi:MAG TPA: HAMP domain-containing sensor histidine kinase [Gaiellaceae bacterium]|nr:HAMP domain-containing sensor histidine kinase [Gaiellaceae bacterium]
MSVRTRSIVAAALATLIAVAVLGSLVDLLVARHLHAELDHTLHARAVEVAQLAASAPAVLSTPGALDSPVGATQAMVEVVDSRDRIVARSLSLGGRVLPPALARAAISDGGARYGSVRLGDDRLRVYAAPLATFAGAAGGGAVLVAASTSDLTHTIRALHALTLLAAVAAAVVGAVAVALLMRGALQPLARLARAAAEIERTGDPRRRLPEPRRADEVGRLAATLNAMLRSLERARDAERRFLADASHELRTPLTALRGNVAHLARHGATPELVADIAADAERLARLADDLLVLSREEAAPSPETEVALDELARAAAGPGVDVDAERVTVRGDAAALERALANLVENARTHGRGRIRIGVARDDGVARLSVEDEGEGVPDAERERVFERFHGRGTGLGLAIVQATAARHGGRATVSGSRFTVELPLVRKASENAGTVPGESREKGTP